MERFAVIGLGRFGSRLAKNLAASGAEVIAVDSDRRIVEELRDQVTLAIALDATDEQALKLQGVDQVDCAVVGIGHNFEANALTTALLKSLRVKRVISRASNQMQAKILSRIGADSVVSPEDESADRWSHRLLSPFMIDHVELGEGYALAQLATPTDWKGKTLAELDLRKRFNVTIVAIKRRVEAAAPSGVDTHDTRVVDVPLPTSRLGSDDTIVIAGYDADLERLPR
ncbi:MAG: potassium channel family protein [Phycisphaerales bacterium]